MLISDFIEQIRKETPYINYNNTRDHLLVGEKKQTINKIGVCWTATFKALQQAKENGINFI